MSWRLRIAAILIAVVFGAIAFAPVFGVMETLWLLLRYLASGDPTLLVQAEALPAFIYGGPLLTVLGLFLVPDLTAAVLICWGVPGLVLNHLALWLRFGFIGFLLLGAANGVLGWMLFRISSAAAGDPSSIGDQVAEQFVGILDTAWLVGPTGAAAACAAWVVMRIYGRRVELRPAA